MCFNAITMFVRHQLFLDSRLSTFAIPMFSNKSSIGPIKRSHDVDPIELLVREILKLDELKARNDI